MAKARLTEKEIYDLLNDSDFEFDDDEDRSTVDKPEQFLEEQLEDILVNTAVTILKPEIVEEESSEHHYTVLASNDISGIVVDENVFEVPSESFQYTQKTDIRWHKGNFSDNKIPFNEIPPEDDFSNEDVSPYTFFEKYFTGDVFEKFFHGRCV